MNEVDRRRRLEELFAEHARAVRAYALRRIDAASAEDTVSEVFVVACRRIDEIPSDALPWLLACARRILANQHRGARRRSALAGRIDSAGALVDPEDREKEEVWSALGALRQRDREVLMLIAWEELTPAHAAAALECSRATLAVRLHRARRRLAAQLDRSGARQPGTPISEEATK